MPAFLSGVPYPPSARGFQERLLERDWRQEPSLRKRALRIALSLAGVGALTVAARALLPVNAATAGFGYLLLILVIAGAWGFAEALTASFAATLAFNYFFFPPVGELSIEDPGNWVALFSFLGTSLIGSRLSDIAKRRAQDAVARQDELEQLYAFSRAILLIAGDETFAQQLVDKLAESFQLKAAALYDRAGGEYRCAGSAGDADLEEKLRETALGGDALPAPPPDRQIVPVGLGSEPIAALALEGRAMPDSVVRGIANLVAIGLERASAQRLAHQIEAARQSEQLRTALIDAMAHEFKTPLTSIKAATTSLLSAPQQPEESRTELLQIADEEADHLRELIEDAVEMARLDTAMIDLDLEAGDLGEAAHEVVASMESSIDGRPVEFAFEAPSPPVRFDRRLLKLAVRQLLDNALKYSPAETPIQIRVSRGKRTAKLDVTNRGKAIPLPEQSRIFERFYRSPSVRQQVPGSGLGLSIAHRIAKAHKGDLTVTSGPAATTFRLTLPLVAGEDER
jgi:two-component system, OmpR family, sensor histidine kinase KdpD